MSRYHSYINSAKAILSIYRGEEPFSSFLKKYFSADKKFGSRDRKHITHLCYCFFRMGKAVLNTGFEEKILMSLFLCTDNSNEVLAAIKPEWNEKCKLTIDEKLLIINYPLLIEQIFPWKEELSEGIDHEKFCNSFFMQPHLFLRMRPGKEIIVIQKLQEAGIRFEKITESCLALPNTSKIDSVIKLDNEAVVQDYNSQRTGEFIKSQISIPIAIGIKSRISVWDCCAGSGGKSMMLFDLQEQLEFTVSDIRESMISNLKKRFAVHEIKKFHSVVTDVTKPLPETILSSKFNIIICDAPCTGSGTWSRTPEQLYFFEEREIEKYESLQKKIVSSVIPQLQNGGVFIYITCSVFKKENEELVEFMKQNFNLHVKQIQVLKGYDKKADSMFIAVLEKL